MLFPVFSASWSNDVFHTVSVCHLFQLKNQLSHLMTSKKPRNISMCWPSSAICRQPKYPRIKPVFLLLCWQPATGGTDSWFTQLLLSSQWAQSCQEKTYNSLEGCISKDLQRLRTPVKSGKCWLVWLKYWLPRMQLHLWIELLVSWKQLNARH